MDFSASAATKDAARLRRRRFCTPPRFFSTLPHSAAVGQGAAAIAARGHARRRSQGIVFFRRREPEFGSSAAAEGDEGRPGPRQGRAVDAKQPAVVDRRKPRYPTKDDGEEE